MNAIVPFRANDVHLNLMDVSARVQPPPTRVRSAHKGIAYSRSEGPSRRRRPSNAFNSHDGAICTKAEVLNKEKKCEIRNNM